MFVFRRCRMPTFARFVIIAFAATIASVAASAVLSGRTGPASDAQEVSPLKRIPWVTSKITGAPEPPPPFRTEQVFRRLKFHQPVDMARPPASDRLFIVEQAGKIYSFPAREGVEKPDVFLDLAADFKSLVANPQAKGIASAYGLVFHPQFAKNRECFVTYALASKGATPLADGARLSRFKVASLDPPRCDPASEEVLLTWTEGGHMGSALAFGPDGMLYISTGDAGPAAPPDERSTGQGVNDLLSCVLRIDVDHRDAGRAYRVPPDNPFVSTPGARGEIWAYGFRNPWKMSFDRETGDLWVADVGWELWELVYRVTRGGNYGWSIMEGPQAVRSDVQIGPTPISPPDDALPHSIAASITGGYVYRGKKFPELVGSYVFGDWETRRIWASRVLRNADGEGNQSVKLGPRRDLTDPAIRLVTFCEDPDGELYLVDYDLGTIYQFARNEAPDHSATFPRKLSETGLFGSTARHEPSAGVLAFSILAEQWMDGATAERFVAIPGMSSIDLFAKPAPAPGSMFDRVMSFPKDTVFAKTLSLELKRDHPSSRRRIETQVLHFDGRDFRGYSYAWNDDGSDAVLIPADGDERKFTVADADAPGGKRTLTWTFSSRVQCLQCHNPWARHTLAFNTLELNREHDYGGVRRNQLDALREMGILVPDDQLERGATSPRDRSSSAESLVNPHDSSADLSARARSYLHANCAHCHRFGGGGSAKIDLRFEQKLEDAKAVNQPPTLGAFGIADAAIIKPGEPFHSVLYYRMAKTGRGHMPHLGAELVDERGLELIHDWIRSLAPRRENVARPEKTQPLDEPLRSTSEALTWSRAVSGKEVASEIREQIIAAGAAHRDAAIRDLFERFTPDETRGGRIGQRVKPAEILALTGNAQRGRDLFLTTTTLECKTCHRVHNEGGRVGPDLTAIGKKLTRAQVLESIAEPSKTIAQEFRAHLVETNDGRTFTGIVVSKTDKEVVLRDAQDKEMRLRADEVESTAPQPQSIMPEGLLRDLTPQEAADLVEFLYSLK